MSEVTYECPICGEKHKAGEFPHTDEEVEEAVELNRVMGEVLEEYYEREYGDDEAYDYDEVEAE